MMRTLIAGVCALALVCGLTARADDKKGDKKVPEALSFPMKAIDGTDANLAQYQGKVVLFVNVASKCGYTPQYEGLEALYEKYGKDGFVIIGVPANEFGKQEPGTNEEIATFCKSKYSVTFPMLSKVVVKGPEITPLYKYLTTHASPTGDIKWNFEKFLIGRNGEIAGRYLSPVKPDDPKLTAAIEDELKKK
jgi:glutathione peroxidase